MYFKESELKHKLDEKITMPMGMLTIVVSVHVYIFNEGVTGLPLDIIKVVSIFGGVALVFCLFYVAKSMFNMGYTRKYKELNQMNQYRKYDIQLKEHNQQDKYEEHLEVHFAEGASINNKINISRTEALAYCKVCLFFCLVFTFVNALVFVYHIAMN